MCNRVPKDMRRSCGSNLRVALYHIIVGKSLFSGREIEKLGNIFTAPLFHTQTQWKTDT